jgi:predicted PurR-regulated permease PerM
VSADTTAQGPDTAVTDVPRSRTADKAEVIAEQSNDWAPPGVVFRWALAGTLGVLLVLVGAYGLYIVRTIVTLVVIALFLAISLDPVVRWLTRRKLPRPAAVAVVFIVFAALVALFIWSVAPPIVQQADNLFSDLPSYLRRLSDESTTIQDFSNRYHLADRLSSLTADLPADLAGGAVGVFQEFVGALASTLTVLVLTIYFMADLPRLRRGIISLFPRRRERVGEIVDVVVAKVGGYMIGNIIISLVAGTTAFICMRLLGVPFALPLAAAVAVADLIPLIGATVGAAACVLVALLNVGLWPQTIVLVAFFAVYQSLENYVLAPRIYRNAVDMPSLAILLVALVGGSLLGLAGAIMAIPIAATVKVLMSPMIPAEGRSADQS